MDSIRTAANVTLDYLTLTMRQTGVPSPLDEVISAALIFALLSGIIANVGYWVLEKKPVLEKAENKPIPIPRVGKDPNEIGMAAARADFLRNGYQLIREGYKKA